MANQVVDRELLTRLKRDIQQKASLLPVLSGGEMHILAGVQDVIKACYALRTAVLASTPQPELGDELPYELPAFLEKRLTEGFPPQDNTTWGKLED